MIKSNIEHKLRVIRYNLFSNIIKKNSSFLIAHHSSDLFETFLLNFVRGCGLNGLLGIKDKLTQKNINIIRPLIHVNKNDIYDYAFKNDINYIIDFSNFDVMFSRNLIRFKITPLLETKWHNFNRTVVRCINILMSNKNFTYTRCKYMFDDHLFSINFLIIESLKKVPVFIRYEIIRIWIKKNNLKAPTYLHLLEIDKIIQNNFKHNQKIKIDNYLIVRGIKNIYIVREEFFLKKDNYFLKNFNIFFFEKKTYIRSNILNLSFIFNQHNTLILGTHNPLIKYNNLIFVVFGIWRSRFYNCFLKKYMRVKFLL